MLTPWKTSSPDRTSRSAERGVLRVLSQAFTLVEMLAVLGVLTVLIAAAGPAMIGAVRGSALQQARNQIAATTALARQKAVTKHTMTALVVLTEAGTAQDYRAFTLLEFNQGTGWVQTQGWEMLPEGVLVDPSTSESTFLINSPSPFPGLMIGQSYPPVRHLDRALTGGKEYAARIFIPGGGLRNAQDPAQLRLVEGHLDGNRITYARPGSHSGTADYVDIAIVGVTGTVKTSRP